MSPVFFSAICDKLQFLQESLLQESMLANQIGKLSLGFTQSDCVKNTMRLDKYRCSLRADEATSPATKPGLGGLVPDGSSK